MQRTFLLFLAAACYLPPLSQGAEDTRLLCIAEQSTGFKVDSNTHRWMTTTFSAEEKIIILKSTKPGSIYEVRKLGMDYPIAICKSEINQAGNLFCDGLGTDFRINTKTLRYISFYSLGYWADDESNPFMKEGMNTPAISIGKCSKI